MKYITSIGIIQKFCKFFGHFAGQFLSIPIPHFDLNSKLKDRIIINYDYFNQHSKDLYAKIKQKIGKCNSFKYTKQHEQIANKLQTYDYSKIFLIFFI